MGGAIPQLRAVLLWWQRSGRRSDGGGWGVVAHWVLGAMVTLLAAPHSEEGWFLTPPALLCWEDTQSLRHKRFCPLLLLFFSLSLSLCKNDPHINTTPNCRAGAIQDFWSRYWYLKGRKIIFFSFVLHFPVSYPPTCTDISEISQHGLGLDNLSCSLVIFNTVLWSVHADI